MNVCFPITENRGLASPLCAHFGSTPMFLIVETTTGVARVVANVHREHSHGQCRPLAAIQDEAVDAIVVGGIGAGAIQKIQNAGIRVFISVRPTVEDSLTELKAGRLPEADLRNACVHHGHGGADGQGPCGH